MSTELQWEGHNISIRSEPALKYLWSATETVVMVDGVELGRTGGFRFNEKLTGRFPHQNASSEFALDIKVDLITLVSVPYQLEVDGKIVSQGRLKIDNWILFLVPTIILIACACCVIATSIYLSAVGN
jgi:hypothetical protein